MEALTQDPPLPRSLGELRIHAVLGQGGSGVVYDATWGPRRVALKVLHPSLIGTERTRARLLTEAARLQTIQHPSVVKVLAVGELPPPDGRPSLVAAEIPPELDVQIRRALSTRAQNRPPHAAAFLEAVRHAAGAPLTDATAPSETARPASGAGQLEGREARLLGRLAVAREGPALRVTGRRSSLMIGMIAAQLP